MKSNHWRFRLHSRPSRHSNSCGSHETKTEGQRGLIFPGFLTKKMLAPCLRDSVVFCCQRAKRLPERPGPRGAKDSIRFRERIAVQADCVTQDERDVVPRAVGRNALRSFEISNLKSQTVAARAAVCVEASSCIHASEPLRRSAGSIAACRGRSPMQTHPPVDIGDLCLIAAEWPSEK